MEHRISLHLDGSFCFLLALMLLLLPLTWVLAAAVAVLVHEAFHAAAIVLLGGRIYALHFGSGGIRMETDTLPSGKEIIAAMAGPLGSAILFLLAPWLPRIAICGAVHCIYNLLPLFPMDGGRILRSAIALCAPGKKGSAIFNFTQKSLYLILCGLIVFAGFRWGILPIAAGIVFLWSQRKVRTV